MLQLSVLLRPLFLLPLPLAVNDHFTYDNHSDLNLGGLTLYLDGIFLVDI